MNTLELLIFFGECLATVRLQPLPKGDYTVKTLKAHGDTMCIIGIVQIKTEELQLIKEYFPSTSNIITIRKSFINIKNIAL